MPHDELTTDQFAYATGFDRKGLSNAEAALGKRLPRRMAEAERLWIAHQITDTTDLPLAQAWRMAGQALGEAGQEGGPKRVRESRDATVWIGLDVARARAAVAARATAARHFFQPKRRGRERRRTGSALERARAFGLDLSLTKTALAYTPEERLRRADEDAAFVAALRKAARPDVRDFTPRARRET